MLRTKRGCVQRSWGEDIFFLLPGPPWATSWNYVFMNLCNLYAFLHNIFHIVLMLGKQRHFLFVCVFDALTHLNPHPPHQPPPQGNNLNNKFSKAGRQTHQWVVDSSFRFEGNSSSISHFLHFSEGKLQCFWGRMHIFHCMCVCVWVCV